LKNQLDEFLASMAPTNGTPVVVIYIGRSAVLAWDGNGVSRVFFVVGKERAMSQENEWAQTCEYFQSFIKSIANWPRVVNS
jgi:hypothetical protein